MPACSPFHFLFFSFFLFLSFSLLLRFAFFLSLSFFLLSFGLRFSVFGFSVLRFSCFWLLFFVRFVVSSFLCFFVRSFVRSFVRLSVPLFLCVPLSGTESHCHKTTPPLPCFRTLLASNTTQQQLNSSSVAFLPSFLPSPAARSPPSLPPFSFNPSVSYHSCLVVLTLFLFFSGLLCGSGRARAGSRAGRKWPRLWLAAPPAYLPACVPACRAGGRDS